jgi:NNP family nitrate/nitrite transporter-like MFS transporter
VWTLFVVYGACLGIELTINNIAALYFHDYFDLGLATAGLVASLFGLMNIFARTLGGIVGDRCGLKWGLKGRVACLARLSHTESAARRDKAASTSLRLLAVLNVLSKYASARQAARASYLRPSPASRCDPV